MNKLISFLVSVVLLAGLSACSDPRAEFDDLAAKAELSLDEGDYTLAQAYIDEALAILPDSPVGQEISSRIQAEAQSQAVLDTVKRQASSSSWEEALASMDGLASDAARMEEAQASLQLNFQLRLVDYRSQPTEIESGELLLRTAPLFVNAGIELDQQLLGEVYLLALEQTNLRLSEGLELGPEDAMELLIRELAKELYRIEDFGAFPEQITANYEVHVVEDSKALVRGGDLSGAAALLEAAEANSPNSETIQTERARVAELVRLEQAAIKKAAEDAKKRAVNAMRKTEDTFENITWYNDKSESRFASDKLYLYMGQRGTAEPFLFLVFMMEDDRWHFFERITVNVDGRKYEFDPGFSGVTRDNSGGRVWEYYQKPPDSEDFAMVDEIVNSQSTRIRYVNDENSYVERTVNSAQKKALANVLLAYEALGGKR